MTSPEAMREIRAIYESLPAIECRRLCAASCGPVLASPAEVGRIVVIHGQRHPTGLTCGYLEGAACTIYAMRPLICRLWGLVGDDARARCPHGCEPERWLSSDEASAIIDRVAELGGGHAALHPWAWDIAQAVAVRRD